MTGGFAEQAGDDSGTTPVITSFCVMIRNTRFGEECNKTACGRSEVRSNSCQDKHSRRFSVFATERTKEPSHLSSQSALCYGHNANVYSCQVADSQSATDSRAFAVSSESTAVTSDQHSSTPLPPTGHSWQLTERSFRLCSKLSRRYLSSFPRIQATTRRAGTTFRTLINGRGILLSNRWNPERRYS
jgi:hypothetical protein